MTGYRLSKVLSANFHKDFFIEKIGICEPDIAKPEIGDHPYQRLLVPLGDRDGDIQVSRVSRKTMKSNRVPANHEKLNPVLFE